MRHGACGVRDHRSASFAGISPIPASSGLTDRHRLNRSGDRQLNRAMHAVTSIRTRIAPATKAHVSRGITEGKIARDAQRYLKPAVCRQVFEILERTDRNKTGGRPIRPRSPAPIRTRRPPPGHGRADRAW
ncbi:transposase [Streptomyces macrosporus]|uniref:transposase n=1 Tax=Streptomyces macrosporus TaxID=44032 RepID=UPI003CD067A1